MNKQFRNCSEAQYLKAVKASGKVHPNGLSFHPRKEVYFERSRDMWYHEYIVEVEKR